MSSSISILSPTVNLRLLLPKRRPTEYQIARGLSMSTRSITGADMKAPNSTERDMGMALSTTSKGASMLEPGSKIKCMGKECFIILTNRWPTMDNGRMISFLVMALFTIKRLLLLKLHSTIETGEKLRTTGSSMKAPFLMITKKAKVNYTLSTVKDLKVIFIRTKLTAKVSSIVTVVVSKENGDKTSLSKFSD